MRGSAVRVRPVAPKEGFGLLFLYRIDEELLLSVEHMDTEEEKDDHETDAIGECPPREVAGTVSTVFEGLDDGCHRVEEHDLMQRRVGDIRKRIDNRRSVHPERNKDPEEIG